MNMKLQWARSRKFYKWCLYRRYLLERYDMHIQIAILKHYYFAYYINFRTLYKWKFVPPFQVLVSDGQPSLIRFQGVHILHCKHIIIKNIYVPREKYVWQAACDSQTGAIKFLPSIQVSHIDNTIFIFWSGPFHYNIHL